MDSTRKTYDRPWMVYLESRRVGLMYLALVAVGALLGCVSAVGMQVERFSPSLDLFSPEAYSLLLSLHGVAMIFLFLLPAIPAVIGNLALPGLLKTQNFLWPYLNLFGWVKYALGFGFILLGAAMGGTDVGWTFMVPKSLVASGAVIVWALGVMVIASAIACIGVNTLLTIHFGKGEGVAWKDFSIFMWSLYGTAILQVLVSPLIVLAFFLLIVESLTGIGFFGPEASGDPLIYKYLFWLFGHAAVFMMLLPALGVLMDLLVQYTRRALSGKFTLIGAVFLTVVLGVLGFGHHLTLEGQIPVFSVLFQFFALISLFPLGLFLLHALIHLWKGSLELNTTVLYVLFVLFNLAMTLMAQLALFNGATGPYLHGTQFEAAYMHTLLLGTVGFSFLAALHHYWPKIWGRKVSEWVGAIAAIHVFLFFELTFIPMFLAGLKGLPSGLSLYPEAFVGYQRTSAIGALLLLLSLALVAYNLIAAIFKGKKA